MTVENVRAAAKRIREAGELARDAYRATPPDAPLPPKLALRHRPAHALHAALTVCTGGLWGIVWLLCAWSVREYNRGADTIDMANQQRYQQQLANHQARLDRWYSAN